MFIAFFIYYLYFIYLGRGLFRLPAYKKKINLQNLLTRSLLKSR